MFDKKDSSLILTGSKFTSDRNGLDAFIMKVNNYGSPIWEKSFGGEGGEVFWDSEIDNEGNYLLSGTSTLSESGTSAIIIKFDKLGKETMKSVVKKFMQELNTMTMEKDVEVNATEPAIEFLMSKGFDAKLGARPLQRVIDDEIKKPLSKMMLFGELTAGGMVEVGLSDDIVPKLLVNFKAKKVTSLGKIESEVSDEKKS